MPNRLLGILWHQGLKSGLGLLVLEMRLAGSREDRGELGPSIRSAHVNNTHRFKPWLRRLDAEQPGLFAALNTAPKLAFGGDN